MVWIKRSAKIVANWASAMPHSRGGMATLGGDCAAAVDRYGAAIEASFAALGAALKARAELQHRSD